MEKKSCCCHNPAIALTLLRLGIVLLFLIPGIMKFIDPTMFRGMLEAKLGFTGTLQDVAFWAVVVFEVVGSLVILLGKLVPVPAYKVSVLGLFVISLVALLVIHVPEGKENMVTILFQLLATLGLVGLFVTKPMCCCGATGCKV